MLIIESVRSSKLLMESSCTSLIKNSCPIFQRQEKRKGVEMLQYVLLQFREVLDCAYHLAGVGVLVVVPRNYLHEGAFVAYGLALCLCCVKD